MNNDYAKRIAEAVREEIAQYIEGQRNDVPACGFELAPVIRSLDLDAIIASVPGPLELRKNCHSCAHLDYEHGDYESQTQGGWVCEKRDPVTEAGQIKLEKNMQRQEYRNRYKRCFEPPPPQPKESHEQD